MKEKDLTKKEKNILMISSLVVVLALVLGISFAYFMAQDSSEEQTITTANLDIDYADGSPIANAAGLSPLIREVALPTQDTTGKVTTAGKAVTKNFTIKNTGTEKMYVHISLEDITTTKLNEEGVAVSSDDLKRYDFMWSLYEVTDKTNKIEKNVSNGSFDGVGTSLMVAPYQVLEAPITEDGVTTYDEKEYNLYIWIEETHLDQSVMMGQTFKATIQAEGEAYYTSPESDFVVSEAGVLTAYNGPGGDIIIPPVVNGITVTSIGDEVFLAKNLTNVIIPDTITTIGSIAFASNNLSEIVIPNSVTSIGSNAFAYNQLTSISIPNSVTSIGGSAFAYNQLTSVFIPNNIVSFGLIINVNPITNIIIPNSVTSIEQNAFNNHKMTTIVIPENVTTISGEAFYTENLDVPATIIVIGKSSAPSGFDSNWYKLGNGLENQVIYKP